MKNMDITKKIMKKIRSGKVKVKPAYLILAEKYGVVGVIALLLTLAALTFNVVLFLLKRTGNLEFLSFGSLGVLAFLQAFPHLPIIIMLLGLFFAIRLLRYFDISYKKPFSFIVVLALFGVLGMGTILANTRINTKLENLPVARRIYGQRFGRNGFLGNIIEVKEGSLIIERFGTKERVEVFLSDDTHFPTGSNFEKGQDLRVVGTEKNGQFNAFGIRVMDENAPATRGVKGFRRLQRRP